MSYKYKVKTEACDTYFINSDVPLTREDLAKEIWDQEGKCADLDFYLDTISISEQVIDWIQWDEKLEQICQPNPKNHGGGVIDWLKKTFGFLAFQSYLGTYMPWRELPSEAPREMTLEETKEWLEAKKQTPKKRKGGRK